MEETLRKLYLDLIKRCILGLIYEDKPMAVFDKVANFSPAKFEPHLREVGRDWPSQAHSMIGLQRMENLQYCVEQVIQENIPGDLIETGVWRGGASIFMRAILQAYGVKDRYVWLADSFEGLPPPSPDKYPHDAGLHLDQFKQLAVSIEEVKANFARYGLLDEQVRFLKGWFRDTLPTAPVKELAVLRLDGDLYESTIDSLTHLYPKLAIAGYVIVDDYGSLAACRQAVYDYRQMHDISEQIHPIDWAGVYWRRSA